jgi:hypothetical protein
LNRGLEIVNVKIEVHPILRALPLGNLLETERAIALDRAKPDPDIRLRARIDLTTEHSLPKRRKCVWICTVENDSKRTSDNVHDPSIDITLTINPGRCAEHRA